MKALAAKAAGKAPRYGPARFPDIAWPEALEVPPPWAGGDGRAVNDKRANQQSAVSNQQSKRPEGVAS